MGLMTSAKHSGSDFEPVPEGTHIGLCDMVVDLGVQQTRYGSKEQVYIGFEVPGVRAKWKDADGNEQEGPAVIGSTYTNSIHEKSILGQHLVSWRGKQFTDEERKGFDLFKLLGAPCMISVTHRTVDSGKVYANITGIMKVPAGTQVPKPERELIGYTACDPAWSGTLDKLPNWLREKALAGQRQSSYPESEPYNPPQPVGEGAEFDDDIPF